MPTLGFLKKKRTREGNTDPSANSQPSSHVTTTPAKPFEQSFDPAAQSHPSAAAPGLSHAGSAVRQDEITAAAAAMIPVSVQQAPFSPPAPTPSPGSEPQNLPSISNLINPPQHDGTAHGY